MIPIMEYRLPNGSKHPQEIERSDEVEAKARKIILAGFCFEAEVLRTGEASQTIADKAIEQDIAITISHLGDEAGTALDKMITDFNIDEQLKHREKELQDNG
jgi:hypothetical protein